jgi:uncharacterized protein YggU (UPF0235/DUF167 family)
MYIRVHVTPGAKKETVTQTSTTGGRPEYTITVREEAERNLANTRIRELIARTCEVPVRKVRIISGHRSPTKIISIE